MGIILAYQKYTKINGSEIMIKLSVLILIYKLHKTVPKCRNFKFVKRCHMALCTYLEYYTFV